MGIHSRPRVPGAGHADAEANSAAPVIAVDTHVLVYAHRRDSPWHAKAAAAVRGLAEGSPPWAIPWPCVHEFLAVVSHPRIYRPASTAEQAVAQVEAWMAAPSLVLLGESEGHWPVLARLVRAARVAGPLVHDARIAALCIEHGVKELWSQDRDFTRFRGLRVRNPLV